jgi:alpha-soluble NSF attachment protein
LLSGKKVGIAYCCAAEMAEKLKDQFSESDYYKNAAQAYAKVDPQEAVRLYEHAATLMMEGHRLSAAAKLYVLMAQIYGDKNCGEHAKAIEMYQNAADCFEAEDAKTSCNQSLLMVAHHSAMLEDYAKAIELFEKVALRYLDSPLLKFGVKDMYFKAMLCWLAKAAGKGDAAGYEEAEVALLGYKHNDPSFESSRECRFVTESLCSLREGDIEKYQEGLLDYDSIYKLDDWKVVMMLRAKKIKPIDDKSQLL